MTKNDSNKKTHLINAHNENGVMIVIVLIGITLVFIGLAFAIDFQAAYVKKTEMETIVQIAKNANIDTAILSNNSDTPGTDIAENLTKLIRANGFSGEVRITFYELSNEEIGNEDTPYSKRVWCTDISLKDKTECVFLSMFGYKNLEVNSRILTSNETESDRKVWKPDSWGSNKYNKIFVTPEGEDFVDIVGRYTEVGWNSAKNWTGNESNCPFSKELIEYVQNYKTK